jgi:hypothetical protein
MRHRLMSSCPRRWRPATELPTNRRRFRFRCLQKTLSSVRSRRTPSLLKSQAMRCQFQERSFCPTRGCKPLQTLALSTVIRNCPVPATDDTPRFAGPGPPNRGSRWVRLARPVPVLFRDYAPRRASFGAIAFASPGPLLFLARTRARWQTGCQMDPSGPEPPSPLRNRDDDPVAENPFGLFPVIVLVVLIVGGLLVAFRLRDVSSTQDCVWSGRKNCAPIDTAGSP